MMFILFLGVGNGTPKILALFDQLSRSSDYPFLRNSDEYSKSFESRFRRISPGHGSQPFTDLLSPYLIEGQYKSLQCFTLRAWGDYGTTVEYPMSMHESRKTPNSPPPPPPPSTPGQGGDEKEIVWDLIQNLAREGGALYSVWQI